MAARACANLPYLDALWAEEIEDRLAAFDRGEMAEHDVAETVARLRAL